MSISKAWVVISRWSPFFLVELLKSSIILVVSCISVSSNFVLSKRQVKNMPEVLAHAPLLLGLLLANNNRVGLTAGTVVVHEQIAEANYLHGMGEFHDFFSFHYRSS